MQFNLLCQASSTSSSMTSSAPSPTPKKIVYTLAQYKRTEVKSVKTKSSNVTHRPHLIFRCPNPNCKEPNREIQCQKGKGFYNPYRHLKACLTEGDETLLQSMYETRLKQNDKAPYTEGLTTFFSKVSPKSVAIHAYITLIVMESLPLAIVENTNVRNFSKHKDVFARATIRKVLFKLTELVEKRIAKEMQASRVGAILHDGWTCGGIHYIGLFASYINNTDTAGMSGMVPSESVQLSLLSCSPMAQARENSEGEESEELLGEAVEFTARTHVAHMKEMFRYYDLDITKWAVCQVADNCSVNKKIATLLNIPHVACKSHLLNLEVNYMVEMTVDLHRTLEAVHETMSQCKQRLRNAALLRNLIDLRPVLHNKTRWSGKFYMLRRFLRIREELIEVSQDERSDLVVNSSQAFKRKVERYCRQLQQIDFATKELQTRKLSLSQCQNVLDCLVSDVRSGFNNIDSPFHLCFLKNKYIDSRSEILHDSCFESGVCKIQENRVAAMSEAERRACVRLLHPVEDSGEEDVNVGTSMMEYKQRLHQWKRRKVMVDVGYLNCGFILGSVAEVERLWSVADNILTDNRMRSTPQLVEAILFLRINSRFWDVELVQEAFELLQREESAA